jgi:tRNA-specific 2-thiouridylase
MKIHTRVRYRTIEVESTIIPQDNHTAMVQFKIPQPAVTPGQGAVFYRDEEVLGAGWID